MGKLQQMSGTWLGLWLLAAAPAAALVMAPPIALPPTEAALKATPTPLRRHQSPNDWTPAAGEAGSPHNPTPAPTPRPSGQPLPVASSTPSLAPTVAPAATPRPAEPPVLTPPRLPEAGPSPQNSPTAAPTSSPRPLASIRPN